jgi:hypothetical protein
MKLDDVLYAYDHPKTFVDIGAGSGGDASVTLPLLARGYGGAWIEMEAKKFDDQQLSLLPQYDCSRFCMRVTPDNVVEVIPPRFRWDLGVLSLDIDSYDMHVLDAILRADLRPKIVCAEINEKIPAPVRFSTTYADDRKWHIGHMYGMSVSALYDLACHHGYSMVGFDGNDTNVFLVDDLLVLPGEGIDDTEMFEIIRRSNIYKAEWNKDFWPIADMKPEEAVTAIDRAFAGYANEYQVTLGRIL